MARIGELHETRGEIETEWKINDFFSIPKETNIIYKSYKFYFSGASWELRLFPYGEDNVDTQDKFMCLYLARMSTGLPVTVNYTLGLKNVDGTKVFDATCTRLYDKIGRSWGWPKFIERTVLIDRKSELVPSDILTVICSIKNSKTGSITGSLFTRHQEIVDNLKYIYEKGKRTDAVLKAAGKNFPVHRMILETRSPVFAAMFTHDTTEKRTGEVIINDIDNTTIEAILEYMYTGDIQNLKTENVLSIYAAAEKYDLKDLKPLCSEFIKLNISVDWVCEVIKFTELYQNEEIRRISTEYFKENAKEILETDNWKTFAKENHDIGIELLSIMVKSIL